MRNVDQSNLTSGTPSVYLKTDVAWVAGTDQDDKDQVWSLPTILWQQCVKEPKPIYGYDKEPLLTAL